ncbi:MAG: ThiF family adenylyltransferase [Thiotrichales bacterium]
MNDEQLLRYSRQIMLPEIGYEGQTRFAAARVLIMGLGGLGSPVAMYLAAAGIGELILVDFDRVDLTNLQRQIVHGTPDIGRPKVASAAATLIRINPEVRITGIDRRLIPEELRDAVAHADVVVDCTDNFEIRFAINQACVETRTPLVSGAVIRMEGQLGVFDPRQDDSPCYQCLYKPGGVEQETCSQNGVLAPVVGIIGSLQAAETLKLLAGLPTLTGQWLVMDAKTCEWRKLRLPKDPNCPVCSQAAAATG